MRMATAEAWAGRNVLVGDLGRRKDAGGQCDDVASGRELFVVGGQVRDAVGRGDDLA